MEKEEFSVLVVDDDEFVRELLAKCLSKEYMCDTASNAREAHKQLAEKFYNIVITDINMPGSSGLELMEYIRDLSPDTVIIVMSAKAEDRFIEDVLKRGAFDFIRKPFDLSQVLISAERALVYQAFFNDAKLYEQWFGRDGSSDEIKFSLAQTA